MSQRIYVDGRFGLFLRVLSLVHELRNVYVNNAWTVNPVYTFTISLSFCPYGLCSSHVCPVSCGDCGQSLHLCCFL